MTDFQENLQGFKGTWGSHYLGPHYLSLHCLGPHYPSPHYLGPHYPILCASAIFFHSGAAAYPQIHSNPYFYDLLWTELLHLKGHICSPSLPRLTTTYCVLSNL